MKKLLTLLMAVLTLLSLTACAGTQSGETLPTQPAETLPPVGSKVGDLCPSFQVEIGGANGATGEFTDPTATGKITVINFWGTWCSPCKSELPHFDQFARENDVVVFAIHSVDGKKKMPAYIEENYPDSPIVFCYDEKSESSVLDKYFSLLGGTTGYPYTVILDSRGVIVHAETGMMNYEALQAAVAAAR